MKDLYEILGIERSATQEEIDDAFRNAAKVSHPDHGGDAETFNDVKMAGDTLRNPTKRKRYDEEGFIGNSRPDSITSAAMEKIAAFFINSIDATIDGNHPLQGLDLVQGATLFFDQQIQQNSSNIVTIKRRIKQYERAIKRLKTRRKTDVIKNMLTNHIASMHTHVTMNGDQIKMAQKAKSILVDYEFTEEEVGGTLLLPGGNTYTWFK